MPRGPVGRPWPQRVAACRGAALALALAAACTGPARAHERLARLFDERDGLTAAEIFNLAQDSRGFLWIGGSGGIVRFDGREFRRWAPDSVRHVVRAVWADASAGLLVAAADEPLWLVRGDSISPVPGPDLQPVRGWNDAALTPGGTLGVILSDRVDVRDPRGRWRTLPGAAFDSSGFVRVLPAGGDTLLVTTRAALYVIAPGASARMLARIGWVWAAKPWPDGGMVALTRRGEIWRLGAGAPQLLLRGERGNGLAVRGHRLWVSFGSCVVGFSPGSPPDTIAPSPWCPMGQAPLVDREGTLWLGAFGGLVQMPEPETRIWGPPEGLPTPPHAFGVARAGGGVRVMTWFGACEVDPSRPERPAAPLGNISGGCFPDARGRLWWADPGRGFRVLENGSTRAYANPEIHRVAGSFARSDGSAWLATDDGLFVVPRQGGAPRACGAPPPTEWGTWSDSWIQGVVEDPAGRLWIARGNEIASAPADSVARGDAVSWRLEELHGAEQVNALRLLPGGDLWVATSIAGVWRRHADRWAEDSGNATLPSLRVYNLEPARGGGWWLLADGWIGRVEPRAMSEGGGWREHEALTAWQGLPSLQAGDLLEDPDGRLWIASLLGLVEMPPDSRRAWRSVPAVQLVEARVGGRTAPLGERLSLPHHRNDLELNFTALSFRDPSQLRYQVRLLPGGNWMETREPVFHAVDLSPGRHALEVRASLDGTRWSAEPARLAFEVRRPWYQEPWVMLAFALGMAALAWAAHRVRVGMLLRLERQRLSIAMDLHDEMGSGLGSIGILAGLAADGPLEDGARRRLAGEIADLSRDLGATLSEIVRSMRGAPDTLEHWAAQLAERAQRLVPGPSPELRLVLPEAMPGARLAPEVRRELMLAAVELLHNAVRHSHPAVVTLGLERAGESWRLWVEDDGRGLPADAFSRAGSFGLGNVRRRLVSVGGTAEWGPRPGGGTRAELIFTPAPPGQNGGPLGRIFVRARGKRGRARIGT
jgi:signal transduction histidine kinase/ligand-binding sensor domain-containing protein